MISIERAIDPQTGIRFCCVFDTKACLPIEPIQRYLNYCRKRQLAAIIRSNQDSTAILEYLVKIRDKQKRLNRELKLLASHEEWLVNHIKQTLGEERRPRS